MIKVGIIGCGFIGGALRNWLIQHNKNVTMAVSDPQKGYNDTLEDCDIYFINIHIPTEGDGTQNLSPIKSILKDLPDKPIFIRTTVLPGTCDSLSLEFNKHIYFMPEFLTQRTADDDFAHQPMIFCGEEVLLSQIFVGKKYITMSNLEAEITKYAHNVFGAVKVTYFNGIYDICQKLNLNYDKIQQGILLSQYINEMHTYVPGPDGKTGYGGKCFPKDVNAFIEYFKDYPISRLIKQTAELNTIFREEKITPQLTIIIPVYNKEKYIAEALQSIFMQKTQFSYKILIADDCSTDNSLKIVHEFQQKYPGIIEILPSQENQKLYKNVLKAYAVTKSDYFCVLDPDDYWIDEYKIEKALTFLEANKDYTIYVTNTLFRDLNNNIKKFTMSPAGDSDFNDYLNNTAILGCTLGTMFRNVVFKHGIPEKMINLRDKSCEESFRGDSFRYALHIRHGKAHCVPDYDAVYRCTEEGLWQGSSTSQQNLMTAVFWINLWFYYDKQYPEFLLNANNAAMRISKEDIIALSNKDLYKLPYLFNTLKENEDLISQELSKKIEKETNKKLNALKYKYKIYYKVYQYLYKKLHRKSIV